MENTDISLVTFLLGLLALAIGVHMTQQRNFIVNLLGLIPLLGGIVWFFGSVNVIPDAFVVVLAMLATLAAGVRIMANAGGRNTAGLLVGLAVVIISSYALVGQFNIGGFGYFSGILESGVDMLRHIWTTSNAGFNQVN